MDASVSRWKIILNFACIYLVWGSTYLAIKYAVIGFTPFFMAFLRFMFASAILWTISSFKKEKKLSFADFKIAALSGTLLVFANALVCLAETDLPSGLVAVFVGTLPIWIMLLSWYFFNGLKPQLRQVLGIAISLMGIFFLTKSQFVQGQYGHVITWVALCLAVLSWAVGTLLQRKSKEKNSLFRFSSVQMSVGALAMFLIWFMYEGPDSFVIEKVPMVSVWALMYLIVFGSVAAFSSFLWLNRNGEPTVVSTYALVNPLVALWLGWLFADEVATLSTVIFSCVVVVGISLVVLKKKTRVSRSETLQSFNDPAKGVVKKVLTMSDYSPRTTRQTVE